MAATAVTPSSSGTPAATSEPNATMRMSSVIGSERTSAFWKSSSKAFEIALSALASPNWPTNTSGLAFWAAAVAASVASTRSSATLVIAWDLERHERRATILGELALVAVGERGLDLVDALGGLEPGHRVLDGGREGGVADLHGALALDQYLLVRGLAEVGGGDRLVGGLGLAVAVVLVGDRLLADGAREEDRDDHEREPAEDGRLAMSGTPARRAGGEVLGLHLEKSSGERKLGSGSPKASSRAAGAALERTGERRCGQPHRER